MPQFRRRLGAMLAQQGRGQQARGVDRLKQVMAGTGQEAALAGVHLMQLALDARPQFVLRLQGLIGGGERPGALGDALLQRVPGLLKLGHDPVVLGDVIIRGHVAARRNRLSPDLDDTAVRHVAFQPVGATGAQHLEASLHSGVDIVVAHVREQTPGGVVFIDAGNGAAHVQQPRRVVEQLLVLAVPGHEDQVAVDHADALGDVLQRCLQQMAGELELLRGAAHEVDDVLHLQWRLAFKQADGAMRRGSPDHGTQLGFGGTHGVARGPVERQQALFLALLEFRPEPV